MNRDGIVPRHKSSTFIMLHKHKINSTHLTQSICLFPLYPIFNSIPFPNGLLRFYFQRQLALLFFKSCPIQLIMRMNTCITCTQDLLTIRKYFKKKRDINFKTRKFKHFVLFLYHFN